MPATSPTAPQRVHARVLERVERWLLLHIAPEDLHHHCSHQISCRLRQARPGRRLPAMIVLDMQRFGAGRDGWDAGATGVQ